MEICGKTMKRKPRTTHDGHKFDSKSKACKTPYYLRVSGKGDKPRPTDRERYEKNYDAIDWGEKLGIKDKKK